MFHQLNPSDVKAFALAGNAIVTLESGKTGARYTYKLRKPEDGKVTFVKLLTGSNNDSDYEYIGYFKDNLKFTTSAKSKLPMSSAPCVAINYFLNCLITSNIPEQLHVYHSCKCGRCGRTLTTPESIQRGIGPECIKYSKNS